MDVVTSGSYHHHCEEIQGGTFLYSEPFHTKPLWMTLFTSQPQNFRHFEKLVEVPFEWKLSEQAENSC